MKLMTSFLVLALTCLSISGASAADVPHQIFILVDDWGTAYPSWYRGNPFKLVHPELDQLKDQSVIMDRAYTYRFCSPSRASLLTGRAGWRHVAAFDNLIPWSVPDCIDRDYSMWPALLKTKGYYSSHVGKWHLGLYDTNCLAEARGFDEDYGFISGGEDHITQACFKVGSKCDCRDLWNNTGPSHEPEGEYNTERFTRYAVDSIKRHAAERPDTPYAMYLALQVTHEPVEAPAEVVALYNFSDPLQNKFHAMVTEASRATGAVTDALKETGMWNNSVVWLFGDNGSPPQAGGSNAELRGGKLSVWEGGVAVPGLVTGGVLPESQRGTRKSGLFHFSDVYATMLAMAGLDPNSTPGPAPVDGLNQWPYLSGASATSPRDSIIHDHWLVNQSVSNPYNRSAGSITQTIDGTVYKLITVPGELAAWYGWFSPNITCQDRKVHDCFTNVVRCSPTEPCLYDLDADPTEHVNIADSAPAGVLDQMMAIMDKLDASYHPPQPSAPQDAEYCEAIKQSGGFLSPWQSDGDDLWTL